MKAKDRRFHIRVEWDEEDRAYTVTVPELKGLVTCGDTLEEALYMVRDAMAGMLEVMEEYGEAIPPEFLPALKEFKANPPWAKAESRR